MNFASYGFAAFLAVTVVLYYSVLRRFQWQLLLAASVVFYAFSGWGNLVFISVTVVTTYITGVKIQGIPKTGENKPKRRRLLICCMVLNFGILAVVKFLDAAAPNFVLTLGISFYTFQTMGYIIDCYRGKEAERRFFRFALFAMFFPQLIQGPISRHGDLSATLYGPHKFNPQNFAEGATRVLWGFFKKLVIADRLLPAVGTLTEDPQAFGGVYVLLAIFLYAITLYADFTGGIDITIGIARGLGIRVKENFDMPFYSKNIAEYWRRWHITMGTWFKDYLFYPISTSKPMLRFMKFVKRTCGDYAGRRAPVYACTLILWFLTGLWHGMTWNFVAWGLANGIAIIISQELTPLYNRFHRRFGLKGTRGWNAFEVFRMFWIMNFIRSFDIYEGVGETFKAWGSIVARPNISGFSLLGLGPDTADYVVAAIGVAMMILTGVVMRRMKTKEIPPFRHFAICAGLAFVIVVFGAYGFGYDATSFIYNQF